MNDQQLFIEQISNIINFGVEKCDFCPFSPSHDIINSCQATHHINEMIRCPKKVNHYIIVIL